jgi:hypothetical protein
MISNGRKGFAPEVIGRAVAHALTARKPKVRYTVTPDAFQNWMMGALPKRMVDNLIAGRLGLKKSAR